MVCKAINPLTELTHGMWVEGASHHHLTKAHQDVWSFEMCVTLKNVRPKTWQDTEGEYVGWLGHCCLLSMQWLRSAESACALARALFVTPVILQGPRPVTHPFTLCPCLLWHMPSPTFLGAQSLEQAHQRSAQGPPVSDPVSTIILYHFPAREETEDRGPIRTCHYQTNSSRDKKPLFLEALPPSASEAPIPPLRSWHVHWQPEAQMIPWVLQPWRAVASAGLSNHLACSSYSFQSHLAPGF